MKIIIAGGGEVGFHLAKQLAGDEHDITLIELNNERLEKIQSSVEVYGVNGSSTSVNVLRSARVEEADLVVAVTSLEAVNINTAILAKRLGAKTSIARVEHAEYVAPENLDLFKSMGIDYLIYPEELAALEVVKLIERVAATDVVEFEDGKLTIIGLKLDKNIPIIRKSLKQVAAELQNVPFRIVAIQRGIRTIIPSGDDLFLPNDQVFVITTPEGIEQIIKMAGKDQMKMENIMILGGGKVGRKVAKLLENQLNVKLIDSDKYKAEELSNYLEKTLVIQGDGRDIDLLAQEGIVDMDGFIALTEDNETNIITCLMAKHLGVKKSIALVDNVDYIPLSQTIGLDSLINKKLIAANNLSRFIRKSNVISIVTLQGIDAEVLEYDVLPKSPVTKKPLKDLKFPKNALIGGYVRGEQGFIAIGDTWIEAGDKVVVFALPGTIKEVERFFK